MPAITSSFTALALAPGALNTGTPRSLICFTGMLLVPAPARPIAFTWRRDLHRVHVVRAHQDRIGVRSTWLPTRIALRGKALEPDLRDVVERQYAKYVPCLSHDFSSKFAHEFDQRLDALRAASRCRSTRACRRPSDGP